MSGVEPALPPPLDRGASWSAIQSNKHASCACNEHEHGERHSVGGFGGLGGSSSLVDRHIQHFSKAAVLARVRGGGRIGASSFDVEISGVEWSTRTASEPVGESEAICILVQDYCLDTAHEKRGAIDVVLRHSRLQCSSSSRLLPANNHRTHHQTRFRAVTCRQDIGIVMPKA